MRAVRVERFGGPEVLVHTEVPDPVPGAGQVVISVQAADVLFLDTMIRRGAGVDYFPVRPPYVPGGGVSGHVSSVGAGVDPGSVGSRALTRTPDWGGYAELALVEAEQVLTVPDGLDLLDAAALLHDGRTALGLMETTGAHPGERVLVTGAAGGLGLLLVQLAHASGARVVAAARGARKRDAAEANGADVVVDYSRPDWAEQVLEATGGAGPDVVFDGVGGPIGRAAFEITAGGGRFSAHGTPGGAFAAPDPAQARRLGITVRGIEQVQLSHEEGRRLTALALTESAHGRLRPLIGQTYPLERAAAAHTAIEARETVGKTLLTT